MSSVASGDIVVLPFNDMSSETNQPATRIRSQHGSNPKSKSRGFPPSRRSVGTVPSSFFSNDCNHRDLTIEPSLNEQHVITTSILGFLVHPNIPHSSPDLKVADIAAGTGIWLLDLAETLPSTCTFTGFDITQSTFPARETWPRNITFKIQDMLSPFPEEELGSYDIVAVRFISSATTRSEWKRAIVNLATLLKPGGWLQWIDSCNFKMYNEVAGVSRAANLEIYDALAPFRAKEDLVIGLLMQEHRRLFRESVFQEIGLTDVHEDVFSSDRLPGLRKVGTKNIIECFVQNMGDLIGVEGSGWSEEKIRNLHIAALDEVDRGVYHTLDQVCIVGKKPSAAEHSATSL